MFVHRNVNWALLLVSILLMVANIIKLKVNVVVIADQMGGIPAAAVLREAVPLDDGLHSRNDSPRSEPDKEQCSKTVVNCLAGGSRADVEGPSFHELDLIGELWNRRQMFHRIELIQSRGMAPTTRVDVLCGAGSNSSSHHQHPIGFVRTQLETYSNAFTAELVLDNEGCTGVLCIRKPSSMDSTVLTRLLKVDELSRRLVTDELRFGPDDFRVRVVGREVVSHPLVHSSTNHGQYALSIDLGSPGVYHLEAEQMYEGYSAFNEAYDGTIPMVRRPILPLAERKGSRGEITDAQHHNPKFNLFHVNEPDNGKYLRKSKFRASKHFTWDQFTFRALSTFQCKSPTVPPKLERPIRSCEQNCFSIDCVANRPLPAGQWVRTRINQSFPHDLTPRQMMELRSHHVHFERTDPQGVYEYHLFSDGCLRPLDGWSALRFVSLIHANLQRTSSKVLFIGDSHMRVTFVHMRNFLASATACPLEDHMVKSMSSKECTFRLGVGNGKSPHQPRMTVRFQYDALLERLLDTNIGGADFVVLGMGSWALGGKGNDPTAIAKAPADFGRWSMAKYREFAKRTCELLASLLRVHRALVVVWMTIPAYPPNTRRFAKLKGEHRANPRIAAFNAIATGAFADHLPADLKERFRVVDVFDVTYPMMHLSLDHNHHTTYAQDAILQLLLNAIVT